MEKPNPQNVKNIVGVRVRQTRQRPSLNLSQVALCESLCLAGLSVYRTTVSRIESGARHVTDYELVILAKCLNVSTAWLLGEAKYYQGHRSTRR